MTQSDAATWFYILIIAGFVIVGGLGTWLLFVWQAVDQIRKDTNRSVVLLTAIRNLTQVLIENSDSVKKG